VMAAHSPGHCFDAAFNAAKIALEHMTPVILLTEGFIANGSEPWRIPSMKDYPEIKPPFVKGLMKEGEKFYPFRRDPETMVPRWAVPGQKGLEHRVGGLEKTHEGVVSTDPLNHEVMVRERAEKVARCAADIPELKLLHGPKSGKLIVVGWGGTYGHISSAVREFDDVAYAHFDYINPLPSNTEKLLSSYEKVLVCELNCGQFADYLRTKFPHIEIHKFNKIQGQPFLVNELTEAIKKEI